MAQVLVFIAHLEGAAGSASVTLMAAIDQLDEDIIKHMEPGYTRDRFLSYMAHNSDLTRL